MAGAKISARILHPGCRAAPDSGRRVHHQSALDKIAQDPNYRPGNIPRKYRTIPTLTAPVEPAEDAEDEDDA